ncbi:hypothetical protein FHG87_021850 [Trinorchestia longiramus]|nr:hypothetical protein FHG87_021850 [Trinorchestia longiramus]
MVHGCNAVQVSGRIYNVHLDDDVKAPDILAYPNLLGPQKCPTFRSVEGLSSASPSGQSRASAVPHLQVSRGPQQCLTFRSVEGLTFRYRLTLNADRQFLNPDLVVMLTLYIQHETMRYVTPVGSCLLSLFDSELAEPLLRVGAYQIRLRHGRPKPEGGMTKLTASDMDDHKPIPALTLLYRILPHTKEYIPPPAYESGTYNTTSCEPSTTELALIHHYCFHPEYETLTVQQRAETMMTMEKEEGVGDLRKVEAYVKKKLQHRIPKGRMLAPVTDFAHFTEYDISKGIKVDVQGAFNLPGAFDDHYTLAYGEIIDSEEGEAEREREEEEKAALMEEKKAEGDEHFAFEEYPSGEQRMMTSRVDMKSSPRAPQWLDENVAVRGGGL